tara:strand:- start:367 stop:549 length:183 start_codon:yes stop_codon:yes gene_type:complete
MNEEHHDRHSTQIVKVAREILNWDRLEINRRGGGGGRGRGRCVGAIGWVILYHPPLEVRD